MTDTNIVPRGTVVRYHGSLTQYHGEMTVIGSHEEWVRTGVDVWAIRYTLQYGPRFREALSNVRRESFTVITRELAQEGRRYRNSDPDTSVQGAKDVVFRANTQKAKLLVEFVDVDLIPSEARSNAGISITSCYWKRCSELHLIHGMIEPTGNVRMSLDTGSLQREYRITEKGITWLMNH